MGSDYRDLETSSRDVNAPFEYKILLMSRGEPAPQMMAELEKLPGSVVLACSTCLELALYLKHESFQFVVVIEEESFSLDCQVAIDYLAKAYKDISVLVTRRAAVEKYLGKASNLVN